MQEVYNRAGDNQTRIWDLLAYAGRYGHQPIDVARRLSVRDLSRLNEGIARIVREENESGRTPWRGE